MAFNSNPGRAEYTATAGQTVFPYVFKVYLDGDIEVYLTPFGQTADDVADLLTITTDYTVSINGDNGGDITLVTPASVGDSITLIRNLDINRLIEYQNNGDLLAETLNQDQNYQTYLIADKDAENETHLRLPTSVQGVSVDLPAPVSDAYFKWSADALFIENDTTIPDAVIAAAQSALDSEDSNLDAGSWANEDEDVAVKEYTAGVPSDRAPTVYSALHWAAKASTFNPALYALLAGATFTGQVKGITPVSAEDLTRKDYIDGNFVDKTTAQTIAGVKTFSVFPITPTAAPTTDYQVANKKYVDDNGVVGALTTNNFLHIQDQKTNGTNGGANIAGTQTRVLNTVITNTITGASLAANEITLPIGDYLVEITSDAYDVNQHKLSLRNVTDVADIIIGSSAFASGAFSGQTPAFLSGLFTLAAIKNIDIRHYTATISGGGVQGFGIATANGQIEVYTDIKIWKVG